MNNNETPPLTQEEEEVYASLFPDTQEGDEMPETTTVELTPEMFTDSLPVETADATGPDFVELTLSHRCDACGAAAVAQVEIDDSLPHLLMCGHHFRKHMPKIEASGYAWEADDEYTYQFTDREIQKRPREYGIRDAGSAAS